MKTYQFTIVIKKDEDNRYLAICPALQGCYTEGETKEEALSLIEDAIKLHIEDHIEVGDPIYKEVGTSQIKVAV